MPDFKYKVRDRTGKAIAGMIDAPTHQIAGERLYQMGYFPIVIEGKREWDAVSLNMSDFWRRFKKVKLKDIIFFSQQLSTLYKAGLPLLTGLESLTEQAENKKLKPILETIGRQIKGGSTIYEAISKYPDVFPPVYVSMVRAGETSGKLSESLDRFVALADRELRTRQRVKEATRYPKIVIFSVILAFAALITFVIPHFVKIFTGFNVPLPLPTRIMIGINNLFHTYWYLFVCVLVGIPVLFKRYTRRGQGKYFWDGMKIQIPLFGPLLLKIALSRFAYMFVMLNQSGIPILQTLEVTSTTIDNAVLSQAIEKIGRNVREGRSLAEAMKESGRFTPLVVQMVAIGESSGTLDEMLTRVTEYYDLEVDNVIKGLSTYIEPILTLILGIVVLFLALAVFLPLWNLASLFKH